MLVSFIVLAAILFDIAMHYSGADKSDCSQVLNLPPVKGGVSYALLAAGVRAKHLLPLFLSHAFTQLKALVERPCLSGFPGVIQV